ncbi:transporter substrate-binding domain-containing protein [Bartonella choladocola]|uniref:Amino acid ABC transporter substrate-binding protein, PAAT family n=1 Tax=Bartonella choladocola TaxID=2750995 RepID=A0A1U9MHD3_9HYPH|nr:transporter substrate-binding domain-containing protein [Bartonella choladocola]AQT47129.1 amino acid ABC transporter substrate-binding protein, PAAT family [Bartonella choladocola]
MKVLAAGLILGSLFISFSAQAESLRLASEGAYPPFNYVDSDNKLHGFDIDIAYALCDKMKVECIVTAQDWDGIIPGLLAKKYDGIIASMIPTEERRQKVDFTNRYYTTKLAVAVRKDSDIKDVDPQSMKGKTIGAQAGTAQANYAEDNYGPAGAEIKLYPTADDANSDLLNNRLDGIVHDKYPLMSWLENEGKDCCKVLGELDGTNEPVAIAIRKNSDELKARLNKAIDEIRADGTYEKIAKKYFQFDVY